MYMLFMVHVEYWHTVDQGPIACMSILRTVYMAGQLLRVNIVLHGSNISKHDTCMLALLASYIPMFFNVAHRKIGGLCTRLGLL